MSDERDAAHPQRTEAAPADAEIERFAGGEIRSYRGRVDTWLLVVYAVLAVWGVYYLFTFWGGFGPGLAR